MATPADREFLARVARTSQAWASAALPLINDTVYATDGHRLGTELTATGRAPWQDTMTDTATTAAYDDERAAIDRTTRLRASDSGPTVRCGPIAECIHGWAWSGCRR